MERKIELSRWKRHQSLLNTIWMHRLYGDVSQVSDDEALESIDELIEILTAMSAELSKVTKPNE